MTKIALRFSLPVALAVALAVAFMVPTARADERPVLPLQVFPAEGSGVVVADFDGDGWLDLGTSTSAYPASTVTVLNGNGQGDFSVGASTSVIASAGLGAVGHLDGDATPDMVVVSGFYNLFQGVVNNGDGTLTARNPVHVLDQPWDLVLADFDGDGVNDVAVAVGEVDRIAVAPGLGDGNFGTVRYVLSGGEFPRHLAAADLDGNGSMDIVAGHRDTGEATILLNDGAGGFTLGQPVAVGGAVRAVALADVDGDDLMDLVLGVGGVANTVPLFPGHGDGTFGVEQAPLPPDLPTPSDVVLEDLDGDGDLDIVVRLFSAPGSSTRCRRPGACSTPRSSWSSARR